jgi:hypothetical protein
VLVGVAVIAGTTLLLELSLTRYFSFRLWYHYAFMIISIALLGLGAAGTALALRRRRLATLPPRRLLAHASLLAAASLLAVHLLLGPLTRAWVGEASTVTSFVVIVGFWLALFMPFFFCGAAISWAISTYSASISSIYAFDLCGAALGCLASVAMLSAFHAEQALTLATSLLVVGALLFAGVSERRAWWLCAAVLIVAGAAAALLGESTFNRGSITPTKGLATDLTRGRILATRPGLTGRIDVTNAIQGLAWGLAPHYRGSFPPQLTIRIDGDALSMITRFDGDFSKWRFTDFMPSTLPYVIRPPRRVLLVGPGGGMDVVNAVGRGAERVVGVEINGRIIELLRGEFASFAGHIYHNPRVQIVHSDGRNFVENTREKFDLIQLTLVDTFAAISSGALSISEDFLYTVEAFRAYVRALDDSGVLVLGRTAREVLPLTVLTRAATSELGLDLARHLLIAYQPNTIHGMVFLFSKKPLSTLEIRHGLDFVARAGMHLAYAPGEQGSDPQVVRFLRNPERFLAEHPGDIAPETDDTPFYFRQSKWSSILGTYRGGRGNLLIILCVSVLFSLGLILGPLAMTARSSLRGNGAHLAYFALIGLGFITIEMSLMVKLSLFLGHPARSISVTLAGLLLFSAAGSLASRALWRRSRRDPRVAHYLLGGPLLLLALLVVVYGCWLSAFYSIWMGAGLAARVLLSLLLIAPLGLLMGIALPIGISLLRDSEEQLVLWAWGLNGVASVVGSIGCVMAAGVLGYRGAFVAASALYLGALLCLLRTLSRRST